MSLMVTGGSGFLGGFVIRKATAAGYTVLALARSGAAAEEVSRLGARPVPGNLDDPSSLDAAFAGAAAQGVKTLVNVASLGFGHAPAIVAAAEEAGLQRAIFVSTTSVTTALPAPSKAVRLHAEQIVRDSDLDWTILRPTMIYGDAGDRNIARLLALMRRLPVLPVPGGGARLQQPVHVEDLAAAIMEAVSAPVSVGRVYDVAGPEPLTFRNLLEESGSALGRRVRLVPVPLRPAILALRAYERLSPRPRLKAEQLERLAEDKAFDISAASEDLGFRPRTFREGVRDEVTSLWM